MKLRDWRKSRKLTQADTAEKLTKLLGDDVSHDLVSRIENGQIPSRDLGTAIMKLTGGAVGPADFYEAA